MPPYHNDPSNEVLLPGVQPPRDPVMTFSAQRYEPRLRPPSAAHIGLSSRNKQEDMDIETSSIWSQSPGRISLISSTAASVSSDGGREFEWNSWARKLEFSRGKVVRYSYVVKKNFLNGIYLMWTGISQLLLGCKMSVQR